MANAPANDAELRDDPVRLAGVLVPRLAPPGHPVPVIYQWAGSWNELRSGLVLLTWKRSDSLGISSLETQRTSNDRKAEFADRWLHDRAIGNGNLYDVPLEAIAVSDRAELTSQKVILERGAMLPPANLKSGIYTLEATFLNPKTGEVRLLDVPDASIEIDRNTAPVPAPELDLATQLRQLARQLPQGIEALEVIFDEIARIHQYDPTQIYLPAVEQTLEYRLQREPENADRLYALALARVLQQDAEGAADAFEGAIALVPDNPYLYAYLAFVRLYDGQPQRAKAAIAKGLELAPTLPELYGLRAIARLMQGNPFEAWRDVRQFQKLDSTDQ